MHRLSDEFENSFTVIMAEITISIEMLKLQHKEEIEEQARQSREQARQHVEQMAVLKEQVKAREVEMKHVIEAARDGTKGSYTPVASFQRLDSSSDLC